MKSKKFRIRWSKVPRVLEPLKLSYGHFSHPAGHGFPLCSRNIEIYMYRNFARLGFLMQMARRSGITGLYRVFFFVIAVALSLLHCILIVGGYAHTSWMFTSAAAERYLHAKH